MKLQPNKEMLLFLSMMQQLVYNSCNIIFWAILQGTQMSFCVKIRVVRAVIYFWAFARTV